METELKRGIQVKHDKRILVETLAVIGIVIVLSFLMPKFKGIFEFIPIVYFLVERRLRKRTFEEIGFKLRSTLSGVRSNWHFSLLVVIISPLATLLFAKLFIPGFVEHVQSRVPMLYLSRLGPLLAVVTIGTFAEEIIYRGFLQERLGWFTGAAVSFIIPSIIFAFMHYSTGTFTVVAYDIFTVFIDSRVCQDKPCKLQS